MFSLWQPSGRRRDTENLHIVGLAVELVQRSISQSDSDFNSCPLSENNSLTAMQILQVMQYMSEV